MADYKKYILSTGTHYISNSGSDENKSSHGGKAGDQTGKEWQLRSWYNRPWTCVLRWPDPNVGTLMAQLSIDAALNDKIGYDQWQRDTYWKELQKVGYLPAKITAPCEEDCTAGVNANVHACGYLLDIPALKNIKETGIRSGNMRGAYKAAGFKVLTDRKYLTSGDYLLPGDVLLYENHHAAANVTVGKAVRSDYTYHDVIDNLDEYRDGGYKPGDRPLKKGCEGDDVKQVQLALLSLGYSLPKYGADGDFGSETEKAVKAWQKDNGMPETGMLSKDDVIRLCGAGREVEITGQSVNVRAAPSLSGRDIGTVHKGDRLPYGGETKADDRGIDWYLIEYDNGNGWVSAKYARII